MIKQWFAAVAASVLILSPSRAADSIPRENLPPKVQREFRAAWVATVGNIDWPSKPGLPEKTQKAELQNIFDVAASLKLNAIIFQVRPACDALYASKLEPWSEYLTGTMGKSPGYDPLAYAIELAHERGIELHAWFNPYRARHTSARAAISDKHISKTRPELVRTYGRHLWLDPGDKRVREYTTSVVMDVLRRYDVDGIHMDDYFYPYLETNASGAFIAFPDDASYALAKKNGSTLSRDDWRRKNVDDLIQDLYGRIKAEKKWVKFGLSPFGIWQPGYPKQIKGFNAYAVLYADAKLWWNKGWLDYFAPQLYWKIEPPQTSYPVLLEWWKSENTHNRHLFPGSNSARVGTPAPGATPAQAAALWPASEIAEQIKISRTLPDPGHIHWNMASLVKNAGGLADLLKQNLYAEPALAPASPWLDSTAPLRPKASFHNTSKELVARWDLKEKPALWVVQTKLGDQWTTEIFPGSKRELRMPKPGKPGVIAISAVDRSGNMGPATLAGF